mmetsp:Transcript_41650/g.114914  ORF Transcript_41650/g.114914 Transcript_41650/m.114914 type:complete len:457 (+) Transcript_41650:71-1441(+)
MPASLYDELCVARTATMEEIRSGYRKRALATHPDKGGSREVFLKVVHAFEVLSDSTSRTQYDYALSLEEEKLSEDEAGRCNSGRASDMRRDKRPRTQRSNQSPTFDSNAVLTKEQVLQKLFMELKAASTAERRDLLQELSVLARACLLNCFAQEKPETREAKGPPADGGNLESTSTSSSESELEALPALLDVPKTVSTTSSNSSRIRGISKRCANPPRYQANVSVTPPRCEAAACGFRIRGALRASLESAVADHIVLVQIKHLIVCSSAATFESRVRTALNTLVPPNCSAAMDLKLQFNTQVHSHRLIGRKLFTPEVIDLDLALKHWRAMQDALAQGWDALRKAWLLLQEQHGRKRCQREALLQSWECQDESRQQRIQMKEAERREKKALADSERRERIRILRARRVQQLDKNLNRLAYSLEKLEERRRDELQKARLKWHKRKDLTMADIMSGPPL